MVDQPYEVPPPLDDAKRNSNRHATCAAMNGNGYGSTGGDCEYLAAFAGSRWNEGKAENAATYGSENIMTYSFTRKQMGLAVSCALALGVLSGVARAETKVEDMGFLVDQSGAAVMSGYGLCWHSGVGPAPTSPNGCGQKVAATPAPLAKAAEPAQKPVAAAPKPVTKPAAQRVTLDADTLFDFNKSTLRPAGRDALDEFVAKSKDIQPEVIMAVGHADRFGSDGYNQRLSEQRAAEVRSYLLSKGIDANRIQTEGKGEMQPTTKAGECEGAKSAKVIACLQPDRRVDVEVIGSRIVK